MNLTSHAHILIGLCYSLSALLGLPSLAGTLYFGYVRISWWMTPPPATIEGSSSDPLLQAGYTIGGMVMGALKFVGALGEAIVTGLLVLSVVTLALSAGLLVTARGLSENAGWARWTTGAAMSGLLLVALLVSMIGAGGLIGRGATLLVAAAAYGLWVVGWRLTA